MVDHRYIKRSLAQKTKTTYYKYGIRVLFEKILSYAKHRMYYKLAHLIICAKTRKAFVYRGEKYSYYYHKYNITWRNERAVEIPIVMSMLENPQGKRILEVGNVLSHYTRVGWEIIDKYEKRDGVQNVDVIDFIRPNTYDLILSISTIEHVGLDDYPPNPEKIQHVLDVMKNNLKKGGVLIVTCPIGYNPLLDKLIADNVLFFTDENFLIRRALTIWEEVGKDEALSKKYGYPYLSANAVFIGIYRH